MIRYASADLAKRGVGYTIVRPGGLTRDAPIGVQAIELNQARSNLIKTIELNQTPIGVKAIELNQARSNLIKAIELNQTPIGAKAIELNQA